MLYRRSLYRSNYKSTSYIYIYTVFCFRSWDSQSFSDVPESAQEALAEVALTTKDILRRVQSKHGQRL